MKPIHLLAVLPFIGILIGPIVHNKMYPLILDMPFPLGWIAVWVALTALIMGILYAFDPVRREHRGSGRGQRSHSPLAGRRRRVTHRNYRFLVRGIEIVSVKLFYAPGSCSLAPHVVLEWIGQPYELARVSYGSPELLAVNPAGAVPVLDTGEGWTLTQVGAIVTYLAERFPDAALAGTKDLHTRAEISRWVSFFAGDLHPAFYPIFSPERYTKATDAAALDAVRLAGLDLVRKRLTLLDAHLAGKRAIVGESRTVIDAYALPMLRWATAKLPDGLAQYPNVRRHLDMMTADPAVKRVLAAEGVS